MVRMTAMPPAAALALKNDDGSLQKTPMPVSMMMMTTTTS
jgi:hypothetical protein